MIHGSTTIPIKKFNQPKIHHDLPGTAAKNELQKNPIARMTRIASATPMIRRRNELV
jgi:hypothetical protein